jgi:hypothetical protein
MKRIDNIIFLILIFCFVICGFWLYQLYQYKPPQMAVAKKIIQTSNIAKLEAPTPQPLVALPDDRDIFALPWTAEDMASAVVEDTTIWQQPHLSTICWIDELPLAIINDEILTEGDKDPSSQFRVETITRDRVGVRFIRNGEYVWLTLGDDEEELSSMAPLPVAEDTFEQ